MFQNFTVTSSPETGAARLSELREKMRAFGLSGFLIPRADAHQGENVAPCDERLSWLTGFTGSAGSCAALLETAGVFIDGRYRIQVQTQIDLDAFTPVNWPETLVADWIVKNLPRGGIIAYDPMLHSFAEIEKLTNTLEPAGISLKKSLNIVDLIWQDRPLPPQGKIVPHRIEFAGVTSEIKRSEITERLKEEGLDAVVLTKPDSIAWLLNIRGSDIENTPVPLCFAVINADSSCDLIVDSAKTDASLLNHLGDGVRIVETQNFEKTLATLSGKIGVDKETAPIWISDNLNDPVWFTDPCVLPKACKNPAELEGSRAAHLRDAVAMVEFLHWVDCTVPNGGVTEIEVAKKLESFRRNTNALTDISFETISASGSNGAICHYRVDENSNREISNPDLLLVDSGGQYLDGTTDITRTIPIGQASDDMANMFTFALKGMIAISTLRWPEGRAGRDIDAFARLSLWQQGLDYDHGTGHGVGAYLGVHEGPASISRLSDVPLKSGMIMSNEPGYYREGEWGIRIENLLIITAPNVPKGGDREMLGFETITWVPIDRRLIQASLLTKAELDWINQYHQNVLSKIGPMVAGDTLDWLGSACAPVTL